MQQWLAITLIFFFFLVACIFGVFWFLDWNKRNLDVVLMIDKNNRWKLHYYPLQFKKFVEIKNKKYMLTEEGSLINKRGKVFYAFGENRPSPLQLSYNKAEWIDSDALMAIINNELVKQIVKPTDSFKDIILIVGAIGGIIAGIAAIVILLIQTGVISV